MHEVAVMQGVVRTMLDAMAEAGASRIISAHLVLGASDHFTEEAARQHFELLARDTPAAGATLTVDWLPATYQCFTCLRQFESTSAPSEAYCPDCRGVALEIAHQDGCYVNAIEVAFDSAPHADELPATQDQVERVRDAVTAR